MKVHIVNARDADIPITALHVEADGCPAWTFIAFERETVRTALPIDDRRFLAIGTKGTAAVFDALARRKLVQRERTKMRLYPLVVTSDRLQVVSIGGVIVVYDLATLETVQEIRVPFHASEGAMDADGRLLLVFTDPETRQENGAWVRVPGDQGVARLDLMNPAAGPAVVLRQPYTRSSRRFRDLSPCGRYILRAHFGSVYRLIGNRRQNAGPWSRGPVVQHPDVAADGRVRIGIAFEVWSVDEARPIDRVVVRYRLLEEFAGIPPHVQPGPGEPNFESMMQSWKHSRGATELPRPDSPGYRSVYQHWRQTYDNAAWLLEQLASLQDPDKWDGEASLLDRLTKPEPAYDAIVEKAFQLDDMHHPLRITWAPDGAAFDILFPDYCWRRVHSHVEMGPLLRMTAEPSLPAEVVDAADALMRAAYENVVQLPDLSLTACVEAIRDLTSRIERDLPSMVCNEYLRIRFELPDRSLSEVEFFDHVAVGCPEAAGALRQLFVAYSASVPKLKLVKGVQLQCTSEVLALGAAARALAEIDAAAYEVLEGWFDLRDPEHDPYSRSHVLPVIARKSGWRTRDAIRFSLRWAIRETNEGSGDWSSTGAVEQARRLLSPDEFVAMLLDEGAALLKLHWEGSHYSSGSGPPQPGPSGRAAILGALNASNPWDAAVLALLPEPIGG